MRLPRQSRGFSRDNKLRKPQKNFGNIFAYQPQTLDYGPCAFLDIYHPVNNHRIEEAIQAGNGGDFEPFHRLNQVLQNPFSEQIDFTEFEGAPAPDEIVQATFCGT